MRNMSKQNTKNTNNSNIMKNNILITAAKLFYDNGYNSTSFEEIADKCEITKPLITYHYKTKANLANEVYLYYTKKKKNTITEKIYTYYGTYDLQVGIAVENRVTLKILKEDPKAYRFYHERVNASFDNIFTESPIAFFNAYDRRYHPQLDRSNDELKIAALSARASASALIVSYFNGKIDCTFDFFADNVVSIHFKVINLPQNEIDSILIRSREVMDALDFHVIPYFEVM